MDAPGRTSSRRAQSFHPPHAETVRPLSVLPRATENKNSQSFRCCGHCFYSFQWELRGVSGTGNTGPFSRSKNRGHDGNLLKITQEYSSKAGPGSRACTSRGRGLNVLPAYAHWTPGLAWAPSSSPTCSPAHISASLAVFPPTYWSYNVLRTLSGFYTHHLL